MIALSENASTSLSDLVGRRLSRISVAAGMQMFQWRRVQQENMPDSTVALHVQCPWRLEVAGNIYTGSTDFYTFADPERDCEEDWDPNHGGSVQEVLLRRLLDDHESERRIDNHTGKLVCMSVEPSRCGGFDIILDEDAVLSIYPTSTTTEAWRLFWVGDERDHLVYPMPSPNRNEFGY